MHSEKVKKAHRRAALERYVEMVFVLILTLYPLRHIHIGTDLWDTGYNYANFRYMGLDSMDPMWFFSTYLATAAGHLLTLLPGGKTLLGMNFYTGLIVSVTAGISYLFCTRRLGCSKIPTFIGEFVAISLCWCPTALLYNYITYLVLTIVVMLLYVGLLQNKKRMLFIAGVLLGLNVFVRFSNLPEAALIVGVWAFGHLEVISKCRNEEKTVIRRVRMDGFKKTLRRTGLCIGGYALAVAGMLAFFAIKYGPSTYFSAIKRLFAMTDNATDYKATSMISSIISSYKQELYWMLRILLVIFVLFLICTICKLLDVHFGLGLNKNSVNKFRKFSFLRAGYIFSGICAVALTLWMFYTGFCSCDYTDYGSITNPASVLLILIIIMAVAMIASPKYLLADKLISGLVLLVILITPVGSNNNLFPAYNNLFIAAPYFAFSLFKFLGIKEMPGLSRLEIRKIAKEDKKGIVRKVVNHETALFPVKITVIIICALIGFQSAAFGFKFTFAEAKGVTETDYTVSSIPALKGIRMSYDKAKDLYELYTYLTVSGLNEKEVIIYAYEPALSFYLEMPSAFNPWPDLRSYSDETMQAALDKCAEAIKADKNDFPVIITLNSYLDEDATINQNKFEMLKDFISENNYRVVYSNDKYSVLSIKYLNLPGLGTEE